MKRFLLSKIFYFLLNVVVLLEISDKLVQADVAKNIHILDQNHRELMIKDGNGSMNALNRSQRSLLLRKLFPNGLFGNTNQKHPHGNNSDGVCKRCSKHEILNNEYKKDENRNTLTKNIYCNSTKYDNSEEKYPQILYKPIINISQHKDKIEESIEQSSEAPFAASLNKNENENHVQCLKFIPIHKPSSSHNYFDYFKPMKLSMPLTVANVMSWPTMYGWPVKLTMDDQPYRVCPELFSDYNRRIMQTYLLQRNME